jgi:hypothetical protein
VAVISELAPYGIAEHMVVHWEAKLGGFPGGCDALPEGGIGPRTFPRGEEDLFASPCADCLGKLGESNRKGCNGHVREQQPPRPARLRMHKGMEITPLVAMLHDRLWALSAWAPDAAQDGLEPDAVLVGRPQLHLLPRVGVLQRLDYGRKVFLKAAWAVGSALTWRGRGTFEVHPRRRSISQPRWGCMRWPNLAAIQAAALGLVQTPPSRGGCVRTAASAARWLAESSPIRPGFRCRRSSSPTGSC